MFKHLIFAAFSLIAMGANAEQYLCQATSYSLEDAGIKFEREGEGIHVTGSTDLEAGAVFAKSEAGSISSAYDEAWALTVAYGGYRKVRVGSLDITFDYGAVGKTEPTFTNYASGVMSAGDVFVITPAKDGWVTLFTRMSPDNPYVVFEDESVPVSYTLGYADNEVNFYYTIPCIPGTNRINFEDYLVSTEEDLDADGNPRTYFVPAGGELGSAEVVPQKPWLTAGLSELPDNNPISTGFLTFRVTAGHKYYFSALGYRAQLGTFVLTEGDKEPDVIFYEYYNFPEVYFESKDSQNFDYNFDPSRMTCEATAESLENAGLVSSEKLLVYGGKTIAKGGAGTIALAYRDEWGIMAPSGAYKNVRVGDVDLTLDYGAVGNTNPTFTNYASGVMSAGAVFEITPEKDGWVTLFTKMNPNKQYVVFEGENGPMSYTLGYSNGMDKIHYTLPYDPDTYWLDFEQYLIPESQNNEDSEGNPSPETYFVSAGGDLGTAEVKPQFPWKVAGLAQPPTDNTGFLTFRVKAGEKYYYGALGSKSPCGSFVLTEGEEPPVVTFLATDQLPEVTFGNDDSGSEENPDENPDENPGDDSGEDSGDDWDPDRLTCEATVSSLEAAGLSIDKTLIPGGTVIARGAAGTIALAYEDYWGSLSPYGAYRNVKVGDVDLTLSYGAVGNSNPTFPNYAEGFSAGAVFEIIPSKDGWVTLFTKLNPNKPYLVMEGQHGPMSYTLGWSNGDEKIHYTLPSDKDMYYIDFNSEDAATYFIPAGGDSPQEVRPQYPWIVAGMEESPEFDTGFLTFRVKAGNKYYFGALGSKAPLGSFVLTEGDEMPVVTFLGNEYLPEVIFENNGSGYEENPGEDSGDDSGETWDPDRMTCEASASSLKAAGFLQDGKVDINGDVIFAEGAAGTIATAYEDQWGISVPYGGYQNVRVGDIDLTLSYGAAGNTNPVFFNYANGVMYEGGVFKITPAKDGWLTLFTKMKPYKQYVVFENMTGPLSYILGYSNGTEKIHYTLPYDPETYFIDFKAKDAYKYFVPAGGDGPEEVKPQFPYIVAGLEFTPSDDTGFLTFNVLEGMTYYFAALGTKAPLGSFVLTEGDEIPVVTFLATDTLPEVIFDPNDVVNNNGDEGNNGDDNNGDNNEGNDSEGEDNNGDDNNGNENGGNDNDDDAGVNIIEWNPEEDDAPVYNIFGQKVGSNAKGLLIRKGKKFIRR